MHPLSARYCAIAIGAALLIGISVTPAHAQDGGEPPTTATTIPVESEAGESGDEVGDEDNADDVLVGEAPGEDVPQTDITVPPRGAYSSQKEFKPNEVLWSSLRAAEDRLEDAVIERDAQVESIRSKRLQQKRLRRQQTELGEDDRNAIEALLEAEKTLQERAVSAFVNSEKMDNAVLGTIKEVEHDEVLALVNRKTLIDSVLDQDDLAIEEYVELRDQLGNRLVAVSTALRHSERELLRAVDKGAALDVEVIDAEDELEVFQAGSAIYIPEVRFPVDIGYDLPLINSWGFPRMPGTPDEHWHEGIDIFAPAGTPLLAAERGVVTRTGSGRLGGLTLWIKGESGANWYYAHLLDFAPGVEAGLAVEAGDIVGYVGNTGNAVSTPAHVHLELHPGGGEPVDPYPLLKVVSDRELAALAATTLGGDNHLTSLRAPEND